MKAVRGTVLKPEDGGDRQIALRNGEDIDVPEDAVKAAAQADSAEEAAAKAAAKAETARAAADAAAALAASDAAPAA